VFIQTIPAILDWSHVAQIWPRLGSPHDVAVINDQAVQ